MSLSTASARDDLGLSSLEAGLWEIVKPKVVAYCWRWIDANGQQELFKVNVLFVHKTIRVKDVRVLVRLMLGPDPQELESPPPEAA